MEIESTVMLTDYFNNQILYEQKFGKNTVVIYQVGNFYEIYEIEGKIGKARELSTLLSMQLTKKNKSKESDDRNPFMIGVPIYAFQKYIPILMSNNYTIIKYDQYKDNKDKIERKIDKIYSPTTYIETDSQTTNYIVCVIIENSNINYAHISAIDLTTGIVNLYEIYDTKDDTTRMVNNLYRIIHTLNPIELIFNLDKKDEKKKDDIINNYQLHEKIVHFIEVNKEYKNIIYQTKFLEKIYSKSKNSTVSIIEHLGLERYPDLIISLIVLLQFGYEHDNTIIKKLNKPKIINENDILILNSDSIYQLNIISSNDKGKFSSLYKTIDFTLTSMGGRLLKDRLLRPITDKKKLNERYDTVDNMKKYHKEFKHILEGITDIEKRHRKALLKKLTCYEFYLLTYSYDNILSLFKIIRKVSSKTYLDKLEEKFNNFVKSYKKLFNLNVMNNLYSIDNIQTSIFNIGIYPEIDELQEQIDNKKKYLEDICKLFESYDNKKKASIKLVYTNKDGWILSCSKNTAKIIKMNNSDVIIKEEKGGCRLSNENIEQKSKNICDIEEKIKVLLKEKYLYTIELLYNSFVHTLQQVVYLVSEIDVCYSSAICSIKYCYNRPVIEDGEISRFEVKGMRNPIIERIINEIYIGNDLKIDEKQNGLIIFGVNSCGKSSFIRSISLNIILAQSGFFVPSSLVLTPYKLLICKINCTDNYFRNQSLFIKEIIGIKDMIIKSSPHTLILSDEMLNTTETLSSVSMLCSTIQELNNRQSSFIISTHNHQLININCIKNMIQTGNLMIKHFEINISEGIIKYDRKLKDGICSPLYGIEIAKNLNFPSSFIKQSFEIRNNLERTPNTILSTKTSKYNKNLYIDECELCGTKENLHTHHIIEQQFADNNNNIEIDKNFHINKNHRSNLQILCAICHNKLHHP